MADVLTCYEQTIRWGERCGYVIVGRDHWARWLDLTPAGRAALAAARKEQPT